MLWIFYWIEPIRAVITEFSPVYKVLKTSTIMVTFNQQQECNQNI